MADRGQLQHQLYQAGESRAATKLGMLRVLGIMLLTIIALHILIVIIPYSFGVEFRDLPQALETITGILWLLLIGFGMSLVLGLTIGLCFSLAWTWTQVTLAERVTWSLIAGLGLGRSAHDLLHMIFADFLNVRTTAKLAHWIIGRF